MGPPQIESVAKSVDLMVTQVKDGELPESLTVGVEIEGGLYTQDGCLFHAVGSDGKPILGRHHTEYMTSTLESACPPLHTKNVRDLPRAVALALSAVITESCDLAREHTATVVYSSTFEGGSWGHFHFYNILHHAERALSRVSSDVPVATLRGILEPAIPVLNRAEVSLLHNDAHPWNVLVIEGRDGWTCSGWLDWEFAWVGDPTWDLVRMDLIRTRPIGPSPRAFYDGYGKEPGEPYRCIYELSILLWMANQYLDGDRFLTPTYEVAMRYVEELGSKVDRIDSLIAEVA